MLSEAHKYAPRVATLLKAAQQAMAQPGVESFGRRRLRLVVEVYSTPGEEPWDATNYLGGIADVLELKNKRITAGQSLDYLGDLISVGLYEDDRQIKEITYKEFSSSSTRYVVTISALGS